MDANTFLTPPDNTQTPAPELQCFEGLGCLKTGPEFYSDVHRAINLMAESREVVDVIFRVHTQDQPRGFNVSALDLSPLSSSSFSPLRPTKFVIHGYLNGRDMPWLEVSVCLCVSEEEKCCFRVSGNNGGCVCV